VKTLSKRFVNTAPMTRRLFLRRMFWTGAALAAGGAAYPALIEPSRLAIHHIPLRIPNLPAVWEGLTIAHLTDLHRSRYISAGYLCDCIARVNALQPDLIVFTGDYLTHTRGHRRRYVYGDDAEAEQFAHEAAACIGRARARYGVFASLGNHDHWYNAEKVQRLIEATGVPVLRNQSVAVPIHGESLPIVGLGDQWTEPPDFPRALAGVDAPLALVLMHNPDPFENWAQPGRHLILAGHTHGGQVNIPFYGPPIVPSRYGRKYAHGLFERGTAQMYVNAGLGCIFPPIRFNCRPEMAIVHLYRA
jgi:predicted MPP superfamily phosphohydrolase